jgi:membrane dipeptidase
VRRWGWRSWLVGGLLLVALALLAAMAVGPRLVETRFDGLNGGPGIPVTPETWIVHRRLLVADLHADTLLWGRDLLARGRRGHLDLPRLLEGGIGLQGFSVVTKVPWGLNIERNAGDSDMLTGLVLLQRWPPSAWWGLRARALYQARRLQETEGRSAGAFKLIRTARDLRGWLSLRQRRRDLLAGFLSLEGGQALEGRPENVDVLYDAGFRMIGPAHFFDTELGGSAHGVGKGGLTALGREVVRRMEERRMLVDLAHASPQTIDDVLALVHRPVVVSHTGVKGTCDNTRNLSDDQLRRIAAGGGLIGIGVWEGAVCGKDARAIARAVRYAVGVAGIDHVALGSDFDGAVQAPFDATGVVQITQALLDEGLPEAEVARIMGGNVVRLLSTTLP